ncbi:hypothetical protein L1987_35404 [Smallanthus sonchifolius]|uniref:Uncharacterized protein n=1 Tax=Smallanthus sonchifolius TaxID=185202 RepID=A0ACB9HY05_9ASTR|nr:hypothetical protein L1987_35404 [Smallanthus sonchifolius]
MGFPARWFSLVKGCLDSRRGSVLVNGSPSGEFPFKRGLRQGDPLSPFLFILALEALSMFMNKALNLGLLQGIRLPNNGPVVSHLCYADDVIFLGPWSERNLVNLNRLLRCFQLVTGLKVNPVKSSLFGVGVDDSDVARVAKGFNCKVGKFPFIYLGLPIGANMKRVKHWSPVIDRFNKRLSSWKAKSLSFAGRVTLAKAVLGSLPSYYLSLFRAPVKVVKSLESIRRSFVWGKSESGNKIRWVTWDKVIKPRKLGGLGLGGIKDFNDAMLAKWSGTVGAPFIFPSFSSNPSIHVSSSVKAALTQVFTFPIFSSKSGPSISFIATIDFFISSIESLMFSKQSATACPNLEVAEMMIKLCERNKERMARRGSMEQVKGCILPKTICTDNSH